MPSPASPRPSCCFIASACSLRDAHALGDGVGDVLAAHQQDAHEARHAALVDDDVGDPGADVDERLDLRRRCRGGRRRRASGATAKEVRSTIDRRQAGLLRPPRGWRCTMSRDAATSRPRSTRLPLSAVSSSSGWKSRTACSTGIGTKSCTWKASDFFSSSAGIHGRSTWRTMTFWFATPMTTFLLLNLVCAHSCLIGGGDGVGVDDLAVADGALRQGHLAEPLERDAALAERQLGGAHARGPDVETDGGSSCHVASPPTAARRPRGDPGLRSCQRGASAVSDGRP